MAEGKLLRIGVRKSPKFAEKTLSGLSFKSFNFREVQGPRPLQLRKVGKRTSWNAHQIASDDK